MFLDSKQWDKYLQHLLDNNPLYSFLFFKFLYIKKGKSIV